MSIVKGLLFDKDGTLIDFRGTWDAWAGALIDELTDGAAAAERLARSMRYDLAEHAFLADSPIIAGTSREAAECVLEGLDGWEIEPLEALIASRAAVAPMAPVTELDPLLRGLRARGIKLGVATNDSEAVARANLEALGVTAHFDYVAGYDSGHGGKPGPGMVLAFCRSLGLAPETCVMVGDSPHDLIAGARAGSRTMGVLTGTCTRADLAPLADVVLPSIADLPGWLDAAPRD
ncbi:HAD family hydrolase [Roseobacteraceae bacterium S113]